MSTAQTANKDVPEKREISATDLSHYQLIRDNVSNFIRSCAERFDRPGKLLDIAPQVHAGARAHFKKASVETLDIDPTSDATYIADLCANNSGVIASDHFEFVIATEVLEHVLQPFDAANELFRILKPGGLLFMSTPFDFRIHGPLPDCWRFTEHGLRALLKKFEAVDITPLENPERWLMPTHYTVVAKKPTTPA